MDDAQLLVLSRLNRRCRNIAGPELALKAPSGLTLPDSVVRKPELELLFDDRLTKSSGRALMAFNWESCPIPLHRVMRNRLSRHREATGSDQRNALSWAYAAGVPLTVCGLAMQFASGDKKHLVDLSRLQETSIDRREQLVGDILMPIFGKGSIAQQAAAVSMAADHCLERVVETVLLQQAAPQSFLSVALSDHLSRMKQNNVNVALMAAKCAYESVNPIAALRFILDASDYSRPLRGGASDLNAKILLTIMLSRLDARPEQIAPFGYLSWPDRASVFVGMLFTFSLDAKFREENWAVGACDALEPLAQFRDKNDVLSSYLRELIDAAPQRVDARSDEAIVGRGIGGLRQLMGVASHKEEVLSALTDRNILPCLVAGFGEHVTIGRLAAFFEHFPFLQIYARDTITSESAVNALFRVSPNAFGMRSVELPGVDGLSGRNRLTARNTQRIETTFKIVGVARWLREQVKHHGREHALIQAETFFGRARTADIGFERLLFLHFAGWPVTDGAKMAPDFEQRLVARRFDESHYSAMRALGRFKMYLSLRETSADSDDQRNLSLSEAPAV
jgi:hypothetical protein